MCCALLITQALVLRDPSKNWDRLAYYGLALKAAGFPPTEVQTRAYDAARESMSAAAFARLAGDGLPPASYRRIVATDPTAFSQQFPFYAQRALYTDTLAALFRLGLPLPVSATWLSLLPALAVTAFGLRRILASPLSPTRICWAGIFAAVLLLSRVAALHGPDAAAVCCAFVGAIVLLERRGSAGVVLVLLAVALRPDFMLFAFCTAAAMLLTTRGSSGDRARSVILAAGAIIIFAAASAVWPGYGIAAQQHQTFIGRMPYPAWTSATWSATDQLKALAHNLPAVAAANWDVIILGAAALLWSRTAMLSQSARTASLAAGAYFLVRIAAYPNSEQRYYAITGLLLAASLAGAIGALQDDRGTPTVEVPRSPAASPS